MDIVPLFTNEYTIIFNVRQAAKVPFFGYIRGIPLNTTTSTHGTAAGSDPAEVKAAGLCYVTDKQPGIRREPDGDGFRYIASDGSVIEDEKTLERIKSLGIPPAYTNVWVCKSENGYLQTTGHDAKGRKQYRCHPHWRETRDETKYEHMMAFGKALPPSESGLSTTWRGTGWRARRCWRRWYACWRRR